MNLSRFFFIELNNNDELEISYLKEAFYGFFSYVELNMLDNNILLIKAFDEQNEIFIDDNINRLDFNIKKVFISNKIKDSDDYNNKYKLFYILFKNFKGEALFIKENDLINSQIVISDEIKKVMLREAFNDYELLNVIIIFIKSGLNINKTARVLFMHRNTLNNKLNKFKEITNFDVRNFEDAYIVYSLLKK